jgi:hypothetical protein
MTVNCVKALESNETVFKLTYEMFFHSSTNCGTVGKKHLISFKLVDLEDPNKCNAHSREL